MLFLHSAALAVGGLRDLPEPACDRRTLVKPSLITAKTGLEGRHNATCTCIWILLQTMD